MADRPLGSFYIEIKGRNNLIPIYILKVKVIDAIMGSGKTHKAIEEMKTHKGKFLYVTPFLNEVERIKDNVSGVVDPVVSKVSNPDGTKRVIYKRDDLLRKANQGLNMATTHSLFRKLKRGDYSHFCEYDLILDEVLTPIEVIDMKKDDVQIAFNEGLLVENKSTGEVTYTGDKYEGRFYSKLKTLCDTANVIYVDNRLLVWAFPPEIFKSFKSVTVLTYLFKGSLLAAYFKYYGIKYQIQRQDAEDVASKKVQIKKDLNVYIGRSNNLGNTRTAFSKNWLSNKSTKDFENIVKTVRNLIQREFKTGSDYNAYSTFKDFRYKLKGKGYTKGFIPVNERATNMYSDKITMIYLANRFLDPNIKEFFRNKAIQVDEEQWALAELIQWIWRGSIRKGDPMNLYIPSKRMREMLIEWIDDIPDDVELKDAA